MAREGREHDGNEEKSEKTLEGGKTVRFVIYGSSVQCENSHIRRLQKNPVDMVRSLVPNLPGLDRDSVYVISGEKDWLSKTCSKRVLRICKY